VNYERNKKGARFFETQCSIKYETLIRNLPFQVYISQTLFALFELKNLLYVGIVEHENFAR